MAAYKRCNIVDQNLDQHFFHVLMENPTGILIKEANCKNLDSSLDLEPSCRNDLTSFLNAIKNLGLTLNCDRTLHINKWFDSVDNVPFLEPDSA